MTRSGWLGSAEDPHTHGASGDISYATVLIRVRSNNNSSLVVMIYEVLRTYVLPPTHLGNSCLHCDVSDRQV
jgi:hypothetical protein